MTHIQTGVFSTEVTFACMAGKVYYMVDYKHSISVLRLVCGPNFFRTKPGPKFGLVLR